MDRDTGKELLKKYLEGNCSDEETAAVETWYMTYEKKELHPVSEEVKLEQLRRIRQTPLSGLPEVRKQRFPIVRFAAVAVILLIAGAGLFFYLSNQKKDVKISPVYVSEIKPGSYNAILTLADGKKVVLGDAADGELSRQAGIQITKTKDGALNYNAIRGGTDNVGKSGNNTIEIPKGGQYQLNLPDGTKIWLNAASSLTYPISFSNSKERRVELIGEAYFEVAKDKSSPFIVKAGIQEVEVLGTHFNVNSYADEKGIKTTLLEGSVRISAEYGPGKNAIILKPNQQATLDDNASITVKQVDAELAIAWKEGHFEFVNADIQSIMRQISRWYNVDVQFEGSVTDETFTGRISRFKNIKQVLKMIEGSKSIHLTIKGRRILVKN
jgi:ferric-dicitrate binding protein FerR (iron transport regulator)